MSRIKSRLTKQEFENVCRNKGIHNYEEIQKRYENYKMIWDGLNDGRSNVDVGATINEVDLMD